MDKIKLFCFPYAGGLAARYAVWKKYLHESIELCPVEMAGRGRRIGTPFYDSMDNAVDDVYNLIRDDLDRYRYAFYGHSMGCLLAYVLGRKIKELKHQNPEHIFFSGRRAPHNKDSKIIHNLPEQDFKEEILKLEGTPKELFENKELMDMFFPVLRADFKIVEKYEHIIKDDKLDCNITVLNGREDSDIKINDIPEWRMYTNKECRFFMFDGGHFFIHDNTENIVKIINHTLAGV